MSETNGPELESAERDEAIRAEAQMRAEACSEEIKLILEKFRCQIVPMLTSEPVGEGPTMRQLLGATYGILPSMVE